MAKQSFGEYLKEVRISNNLSITKLAEVSGFSRPYLSQIESGHKKPTLEVLKRLADGLCYVTNGHYSYGTLLEKAGYEELALGQQYKELLEDFSEDPEQAVTEALGQLRKSIQADNVEQVLTDNQSTVEQHVTADNLYDLKRVFKQISKPVTFGNDTLTVKEKAMLYDFVEIMLKHRED